MLDMKSVKDYVLSFDTESEHGFNPKELKQVVKDFGGFSVLSKDKFDNALNNITCMVNERNEIIHYHIDVIHALKCGLENRNLKESEWD